MYKNFFPDPVDLYEVDGKSLSGDSRGDESELVRGSESILEDEARGYASGNVRSVPENVNCWNFVRDALARARFCINSLETSSLKGTASVSASRRL